MKIALLTFIRTNNYGATLQGYATTRYLQNLGHEVILLNVPLLNAGKDRSGIVSRVIRKINGLYVKLRSLFDKEWNDMRLEKIRMISNLETRNNAKYYDDLNMTYFDAFREKHLPKISAPYYSDSDFQNNFPNADLFIVGSDQVWNLWVTNNQFGLFFFSFLKRNQKRISYAASFGGSRKSKYFNSETIKIKEYLKGFDSISIRDSDSKYILNNVFNLDGVEVLDPTFLLDDYEELLNESDINASGALFSFKYIINEYWINAISFVADNLGLRLRMDSCLIPFEGIEFKPECTIYEWLRLIKTSDFVFTDSFHGMIFCILFKKQFIVTPSYKNGEGRYIDLAKKLGLEDRLYFSTKQIYSSKAIWMKKIDYELVYSKLDKLVIESKEFLLSHLN